MISMAKKLSRGHHPLCRLHQVDVPQNRLGLADWLTDRDHPLFARVMVNRLWQMMFGVGIVQTAEDFGTQGERPTHPELLDYLSREFAASDWDIKRLIKQLVLSSTYRQSSVTSPELLAEDRDNRLLARGPRYRMSAEMIRDAALATSGLLVDRVGGPSVKPYQPPGLWIEMQNRPYEPDHGEKLYRRSLYTYIKRSVPPPNMVALDATNREVCTVRRQRTSTPLAALVMLNDPTFVEAARALAGDLLQTQGLNVEDCIREGYHAYRESPSERKRTRRISASVSQATRDLQRGCGGCKIVTRSRRIFARYGFSSGRARCSDLRGKCDFKP